MSEAAQAGQPSDPITSTPEPEHVPDFNGEFDAERAKRTIGNLRDSEKKLKAQVAELSAKAQELDKIKESEKTELQKLQEQYEAERTERVKFERQVLRAKVALAKSLPAELVDRLQGETEEELNADADKLLTLVAPRNVPRAASSQGTSEPKNGAGGSSMNDRIRQAAGY